MAGDAEIDSSPDPQDLARLAGLTYVHDSDPGFARQRRGRGFTYCDEKRRRLTNDRHLARIEGLKIPPAWENVWICRSSRGHLQATGRDERGRKQYRYHDRWQRASNWSKFHRLESFGQALPALRRQVRRDLIRGRDDRTRVVALAVTLLDRMAIRVGNQEYTDENDSHGLTTLCKEHVRVSGNTVRLRFTGKSGQDRDISLTDVVLSRRVRRLLKLSGDLVFQSRAEDGSLHAVDSEAVNAYLHSVAPAGCTAKTFRTWHGTVAAFEVLAERCLHLDPSPTKTAVVKSIREAVSAASELLGNTPAVCRSYYVHPGVCELFQCAELGPILRRLRPRPVNNLSLAERRLLAILKRLRRIGVSLVPNE